jgi:hypothetical protein
MTELVETTSPPGALTSSVEILGLLGVARLMLILNVTVVAIALPRMGADLGLGRETLRLGGERLHRRGKRGRLHARLHQRCGRRCTRRRPVALVLTPGHRAT